jgi:hypothetical protein
MWAMARTEKSKPLATPRLVSSSGVKDSKNASEDSLTSRNSSQRLENGRALKLVPAT